MMFLLLPHSIIIPQTGVFNLKNSYWGEVVMQKLLTSSQKKPMPFIISKLICLSQAYCRR
jgi:hypothetical protein